MPAAHAFLMHIRKPILQLRDPEFIVAGVIGAVDTACRADAGLRCVHG